MPSAYVPWSPELPQHIDVGYLLSVLKDSNHGAQSVQERSVVPAHVANPPDRKLQAKFCQHWYHLGICKQNDNHACPFIHELQPGLKMAKLPIGLKKKHKQGCGLEFCPWKEGKPEPTVSHELAPSSQFAKKSVLPAVPYKQVCWYWYHFGDCTQCDNCSYDHKQGPGSRLQMPPPAHGAHPYHGCGLDLCPWNDSMPLQASKVSKKRKGRDEPSIAKRSRLDYDDEPKLGKQEYESTCFYWYHGFRCAKSLQPAFSYLCGWKHGMTDPPTIVPVPPADDHAKQPCELEWCASHLSGSTAKSGQSLAPQNTNQQASTRNPTNTKKKQVNKTCFFWYHGHCARSQDPRTKAGCNFLHELTETPSMVQPPPGYKHQSPCTRPWCPGDAREALTLKHAAPDGDEAQNSDTEGKSSRDDSDDWLLTGFD